MIDVGNFGPDISLPDQHGNARALYSQEIAGVSNPLFFVEDQTLDRLEKALSVIASGFSAAMARPLVVTVLSPEQALAAAVAVGTDFSILSDPDANMMTAIAGRRSSRSFGTAVFDRNGRLIGAGIDDSLENLVGRAAKFCAEETALYESGMRTAQAPVLFIPRILEEPECAHLIEFWEAGEKRRNEISSGTAGNNVSNASAEV